MLKFDECRDTAGRRYFKVGKADGPGDADRQAPLLLSDYEARDLLGRLAESFATRGEGEVGVE